MYQNLKTELSRKGISQVALANVLGLSEKTMQNKLKGRTDFSFPEAMIIRQNLLPEFTLEYLFDRK